MPAGDQERPPDVQSFYATYDDPKYEEDVLKFPAPTNASPDQEALIADIVALDHRSIFALKPKTWERKEVKRLLWNATNTLSKQPHVSRLLYQKAEAEYYRHVRARNRSKYLLGMVIGVLVAGTFGTLIGTFGPLEPYVSDQLLFLFLLFAGMGSIASVLTRLSSIDLDQDASNFLIIVSGATRPIVAIFFALVVYLILDLKILGIQFVTPSQPQKDGVYLISSFLCGFSERFAEDIISRAGTTVSEGSAQEKG